ncbi:hypothetical protein GTY41_22350 [Streptomyces sp. SID685]|nr:hypothetical protein [Streptomyces sp. SID685]
MISPEKIPTFTGDLVRLHQQIISLRQAAKAISEHGGAVHTRFQHLDAFYKAPEAEQLFATTQPVRDTSSDIGDKLDSTAGALETYMAHVADIVNQLETLREQARVFVASVKGHDGGIETWRKDPDKVAEHQAIWDGVNTAVAAFEQAEVSCADKITALVDGTQWHIDNGKPDQKNAYGFSADQLDHAQKLPWGSPEHEEMLPFGIDYHLKQVGIGIWDSAKGSVTGLVDLLSPGREGSATREGLVRVIVGAEGYLLDPNDDRNSHLGPAADRFMEDSKPYAREFAQSLVGWDDWSTNPGKAFGTVIFNGLTLGAGPLGAASRAGSAAGEAGAVARVAGTVARIGETLDPIGAAAKTVGIAARTLPKVSDLVSGVRAATEAATTADKAHSFLRLSDGSHLQIADGEFIPGKHGVPDTNPTRHEPAATDRSPSVAAPDRPHELVGASVHSPDASAHSGENLTPQADHHTPHRPTGGDRGEATGRAHHIGAYGGQSDGESGAAHHPGGQHAGPADHHGHGPMDGPDPARAAGGGVGPDGGASTVSEHHESPAGGEPQPLERGSEAERRVHDAIKKIPGAKRPKPNVMERVLDRLASEADGQRVADIIGSGQFNQGDEYGQVVSALGAKREQMFQPAADQLIFADDLVRSGVPAHTIDFEQKFPVGADMDIRIKDESGDIYAYQLKHLNDPQDPVSEITRGKYLLQLAHAEADHSVLLVDGGRGTIAEWMANGSYDELMAIHGGARGRKGTGITFVIRLEDGNLVIPPGSKTDPKDML